MAHEIFDRHRRFGFVLLMLAVLCAPECPRLCLDVVADEGVNTGTVVEASKSDKDGSATVAVLSKNADSEASATAGTSTTDLLAEDLQKHWEHFSSKGKTVLEDVWKVRGSGETRVLVCVGDPKGFLCTKSSFTDFDLSFEWKYESDPNGNSGVLVFTQNEPRLWPTSMQVQLHQPSAGAVFPSGDAKSDNSTDPTAPPLALAVGQWNSCQVIARNGRLSVKVNDRIAGEVSGCSPMSGRIAIQSEGSETHFRKMQIRRLKPAPIVKPKSPAAESSPAVENPTTSAAAAAAADAVK